MFVYYVNALDKYMCYVQDSLEEQASQGSFVPHGRQDVLTAAIGQPEHPGRVRAWSRCHHQAILRLHSTKLSQFLFHPSRRTRAAHSTNQGPTGGVDHRKSDSIAHRILQPDAVPASVTNAITGTCTASGA